MLVIYYKYMKMILKKLDYSYLAVRRQLDGMVCKPFEVGIRAVGSGKMMSRVWPRDKILEAIPWLKLQNLKDADIYVRAAHEGSGLVLVDDVTLDAVERMKGEGLAPAMLVETSPMNYQVWIRLAETLTPQISTACAKALARRYKGDLASADWRHYGRLAGFTNRKPAYTSENNDQPWVLCHEANSHVAQRGAEFVQACTAKLEAAKKKSVDTSHRPLKQKAVGIDPRTEFIRQWHELAARYGTKMDSSRADFMICRNMIVAGFDDSDIVAAMLASSPALSERKTGHEADYINRTINAARQAASSTCISM